MDADTTHAHAALFVVIGVSFLCMVVYFGLKTDVLTPQELVLVALFDL